MELDRFQVLRSYAESIKTLANADKELARELSYWIIMYGIYWDEPTEDTSPIVKALFTQIKIPIDTWKNISKVNSENWKKWWRPKKDWENSQKANWKRNENENKTNENQKENEHESEKKQNIKYKKENIKDNKINNKLKLISESLDSQEEYWNKEVNLCLDLVKKYNNWIINWADSKQRKYARNLIRKLNKLDSVVKGEYKRYEVLESILLLTNNDKYYATKTTSPELIFNNIWPLIKRCAELWKQNQGTTTLELI